MKYRYHRHGKAVDSSIDETWQRVARAVAAAEKAPQRDHWTREFNNILEGFKFLPGGRILAGAGTEHLVTLFNCFVMNIAEDSLPGIFDALKEGAITLQQGGGVGYDFSVLRPCGDEAKKTGIAASGPVSFMRIWDTTCSILLSTGARRGAMMGVMRCDHPDIQRFIAAKADPHELRHFNVSVMVSDAFMAAVKADADWELIFPVEAGVNQGDIVMRQWGATLEPVACRVYARIKARELWQQIIRSAYDYAEPGVLFSDTINRTNNLWYCERINATNPCGEIPLPAYGACDLGSINLTQFVTAPFTPQAAINWNGIEETVRIATRLLDNIIDVSNYPLWVQKQQAIDTRRIGLGLTGLADAFVMLGVVYGSSESVKLARELMQRIATVTWQTSIELAEEKGVFPFYKAEYLQGEFVNTLDSALLKQLEKCGVRNSHHNAIAPTGTISLLANNISNGVEPIYSAQYARHVRMVNDEVKTFTVQDYAYRLWQELGRGEKLPPAWQEVESLLPDAHLQIQGAMQPYVDNAISKTINLPRDFPFEKLADVYTKAYELGLKGCTVFRPNPVTGSVLEEKKCCGQE